MTLQKVSCGTCSQLVTDNSLTNFQVTDYSL